MAQARNTYEELADIFNIKITTKSHEKNVHKNIEKGTIKTYFHENIENSNY